MELKFRAWHNDHKKYYDVVGLSIRDDFCTAVVKSRNENEEFPFDMFMFDEVIIEQYTGLKDKNGKEIYVGDIVDFGSGVTIIVRNSDIGNINVFTPTIIGNIHENKDLIEEGM